MKKQILILMLGVAIAAINPAFAMDNIVPDDIQNATSSRTIQPAPLLVIDIEKTTSISEYLDRIQNLGKSPLIQTPSGDVYSVSSTTAPLRNAIFYLREPWTLGSHPRAYQRTELMREEKIEKEGEIHFVYQGGTYQPMYRGKPLTKVLNWVFEEKNIIFKKTDKSL